MKILIFFAQQFIFNYRVEYEEIQRLILILSKVKNFS